MTEQASGVQPPSQRDEIFLSTVALWLVTLTVAGLAAFFRYNTESYGWVWFMFPWSRRIVEIALIFHVAVHFAVSMAIYASRGAVWTIALSHLAFIAGVLFQADFDDVGPFFVLTARLAPPEWRYVYGPWLDARLWNVLVFLPVIVSWILVVRLRRLR